MANRRNSWAKRRKRWALETRKKQRQPVTTAGPHHKVGSLAWCPHHQKEAFTRRDARRVPRALGEAGMRAYPCDAYPANDWWHTGHLPKNVRLGYVSADEVYGRTGHEASPTEE